MVSAEVSETARGSVPLLWILLPLLFGYVLAEIAPGSPPLLLAGFGLLAAFAAYRHPFPSKVWMPLFLTATSLLSWSWRQALLPPPTDRWELLPAREVDVDIEIFRIFNRQDAYGRLSGLGRITAAPVHLADTIGQVTYFSLKPNDDVPEPLTHSQVRATKGVMDSLTRVDLRSEFDTFLYRNDVRFRLTRGRIADVVQHASPFYAFCSAQRQHMENALRRGIPADAVNLANIYVAMLLGEKAMLQDEQRDAFATSGTLHFFAISGLHIGVIALSLSHFLGLLRIRGLPAAFLALAVLSLYVEITGASPSAKRAFGMIAFFWSAKFLKRQPSSLGALTASAVGVLIIDPSELWGIGFQLSYTIVAAILLYGLPLASWLSERWLPFRDRPKARLNSLQRSFRKAVRALFLSFSISLSATLISSPISIAHFGNFSPGAVILNMLLVPAASLVIVTGFLSLLAGLAGFNLLNAFLNHSAWVLIALMKALVNRALEVSALFPAIRFSYDLVAPLCILSMLAMLLIGVDRAALRRPWFYLLLPTLLILALTFSRHQ